jgi:hypothetical protein
MQTPLASHTLLVCGLGSGLLVGNCVVDANKTL